jgi:predicted CoA-substrate-specific enzyme activase
MNNRIDIGIDIGTISVQLAMLCLEDHLSRISDRINPFFFVDDTRFSQFEKHRFVLSKYHRHFGEPHPLTDRMLESVFELFTEQEIGGLFVTGSVGKKYAEKRDYPFINGFRSVAEAVGRLYPDVRTIFEMGGETSKYIRISHGGEGNVRIDDYEMNGECAAGTGSFFDQQAGRLNCKIEEVSEILDNVDRCANIAGRCSVFAKSDMIHAQQRGYEPPEVLKGLCKAVVRNFRGSITKGKRIEPRVAFVGGVAANRGVVEAFRDCFDLNDGELFVPKYSAWMGAMGSAMIASRSERIAVSFSAIDEGEISYPTTRPLSMKKVRLLRNQTEPFVFKEGQVIDVFLGIDVGSVSTNLALVTDEGVLVHGIYRMTEGRPIQVVSDSLDEMSAVAGNRVRVRGVGTTGSGRELVGLLVGADVIKDEITAHKMGALHVSEKYLNKTVDTIFEIGGQDSKFISLNRGVVVDFSLNEACAAGTGSFLEEQARQLGISIKEEFSKLALKSNSPLRLGERCTVFMEKELSNYLQHGVAKEDIAAGLAYSVVQNYLNRVVKKRKIGDAIFFQGGTAYNDSVAAAFSTILDKEIIVPPHNGIIGAIGAALLAKDRTDGNASTFKGWDLKRVQWQIREFECQSCSNHCTIQEVEVDGEKSYWGDKCSEKYRKRSKSTKKAVVPDLIIFRETVFYQTQNDPVKSKEALGKIGFPRCLFFYDRLPFWSAYFKHLGFDVVLSGPSKQDVIHAGVEAAIAEPCFPVQVAHGHLMQLQAEAVDVIFLPHIVNEEDPTNSIASFLCPWAQTIPLIAKHAPALEAIRDKTLSPSVQFRMGLSHVNKVMLKELSRYGVRAGENRLALQKACESQSLFRQKVKEKGEETCREILYRETPCVVVLGRPYNLYDSGINLNILNKLRSLYGVDVIPMDFLPLDSVDIRSVHDHMFWNYGRRILQAARFTRDHSNLHVIFISNFKCGPDSYIRHYIEDACGKPFLFLQLDSHANDAGIMTRIEAFLESKKLLS